MDSKQLAMHFGDNSSLTHNRILSQWERALEERARDVLSNANILEELDLYQPIYEDKHAWMMEQVEPTSLKPPSGSKWLDLRALRDRDYKSPSSFFADVCGAVVSQQKRHDPEQRPDSCFADVCGELVSQHHDPEQRPDGVSLGEILRVFPPETCRLGGFADGDIKKLGKKIREAGWGLEECGKASYTVKMCLEAGYTENDFKESGFNRLRLVSGFKAEDLASIGVFGNGTGCRELKEAGFSLEQCGQAGYTVKTCHKAGYTIDHYKASQTKEDYKRWLGFLHHFSFTQEDLAYIGVPKNEGCKMLKDAEFRLEQCGKAGYTVKMCLEAGYTKDDFKGWLKNVDWKQDVFAKEDLESNGIRQ